MAVIEDRAMRETSCFGSGGCAGGELDIDDVVIGEVLGWKRIGGRAIEKVKEWGRCSKRGGIYATRGVVHEDQVFEAGNSGGF
jgi:hypothetical protein